MEYIISSFTTSVGEKNTPSLLLSIGAKSCDDFSFLTLDDNGPIIVLSSNRILVAFLLFGPMFGTLNFSWSTILLN